ncbi:MAG TPA: hypothetical protein VIE15_03095, partial [Acidimicrobiales bacterium]
MPVRPQSDPGSFKVRPLVSAIVATGAGELAATLSTLDTQSYEQLEVVVACDHALDLPGVTVVIFDGNAEDRINAAGAEASGEFLVILQAGDLLDPACVSELVGALQQGADAVYGDEERLGPRGETVARHRKPATLGRETLLSYDVVGAPLLVRSTLFAELGGFAAGAAPVAAHDFALRLAERSSAILHVPAVLLARPIELDPDPADATAATISVVTAAIRRL